MHQGLIPVGKGGLAPLVDLILIRTARLLTFETNMGARKGRCSIPTILQKNKGLNNLLPFDFYVLFFYIISHLNLLALRISLLFYNLLLPRPEASFSRAARLPKRFGSRGSSELSFVPDTLPKCIGREGLGRQRAGTAMKNLTKVLPINYIFRTHF